MHPTFSLKSERHLPWDIQESQPPVSFRSSLRNTQDCNQSKIDSRPTGRDKQRGILRLLGMFADTPLCPVLIKISFSEKPGPPWEQPSPEESAMNCGLLVVSKRLLRARRGQPLTLARTRLRHQSDFQREKLTGKIYTLMR